MAEKAPAFQFYPKDYLADKNVRVMTLKERGAYVELMAIEWNEKGLPNDDEELAMLSGLGEEWAGKSGEKIKRCFRVRGSKLVHPRLEKEREKQRQRRLECSNAGKASAEARKNREKEATDVEPPLDGGEADAQPKPNTSSSSSSSFPKKKKDYSQSSNELRLATLLWNKILDRKPDYKKPNLQKWAESIDKALRIDKRKPATIEKVIIWAQDNDFWQDNVLCTQKLRKQFDKLELEMNKDPKKKDKKPLKVCTKEDPMPQDEPGHWQHKELIEDKTTKALTCVHCKRTGFG